MVLLLQLPSSRAEHAPVTSQFCKGLKRGPLYLPSIACYWHITAFPLMQGSRGGAQVTLLNILTELKKCCNHPVRAWLQARTNPCCSRSRT